MFVVNAGAEDDVGEGVGDVDHESFAGSFWISIEDSLDLFPGLSAPVSCGCLSLCEVKGKSEILIG